MLNTSFFFLIKHNIWEIIFGSFYFTGSNWSNAFRFGSDSVRPWTVETLSMFTLQNSGECLQTKENKKGKGKGKISVAVMAEGRWKRRRPVTLQCSHVTWTVESELNYSSLFTLQNSGECLQTKKKEKEKSSATVMDWETVKTV
jgi:hypothetical protein